MLFFLATKNIHGAQKPDDFYVGGCDYALVNDCASAEEFAARARALFQRILEEKPG